MPLTGKLKRAIDKITEPNFFITSSFSLNPDYFFDELRGSAIHFIFPASPLRLRREPLAREQQRRDRCSSDNRAAPRSANLPCHREYYPVRQDRKTAFWSQVELFAGLSTTSE